jgi:hypothetical protein
MKGKRSMGSVLNYLLVFWESSDNNGISPIMNHIQCWINENPLLQFLMEGKETSTIQLCHRTAFCNRSQCIAA